MRVLIVRSRYIFASLVLILSSFSPLPTFAVAKYDPAFFGKNDILFYNPTDTGCPTPSADGLTGDTNEEKVWNYLVQKGLTPEQTAAVMSSLNQKSNLTTDAIDSTSYGIAGWSGTALDNLNTSATSNSKDASSLAFQLDYLYTNLNALKPTRPENVSYPSVWAAVSQQKSADDALVVFYGEFMEGDLLNFDQPASSEEHKAEAKKIGTDYSTSKAAIIEQLSGDSSANGLNPDGSQGAQYYLTTYNGPSASKCVASGTAVHPIKDGDGVNEGYGGPRPGPGSVYCGGMKWHNGYDLQASMYTPVKSAMSGTVTAIDYAHPALDTVSIKNSQGFTIRYMHMNTGHISVKVGDTITTGQQIGESGDGNGAYGAHLHVEIDVTGNTNPQVAQLHANSCGIKSVNPNLFFKIFGVTLCPRTSCDNPTTEL